MNEQFMEIKELILGLRVHVDTRFNQVDARLNAFDERFNEIDERDRLLRDYIDDRFTQMHDYVDERTRDMETRMLRGFQKWATSIELTVKPMPIRIGSIEERLALLEERWKDIGNQDA
jgi:hypothetical protein